MDRNSSAKPVVKHHVTLDSRKSLELDGIEDVLGFEDCSVLLQTNMGVLNIEGEGLHIRHMSMEDGSLIIDGKINGMLYIDKTARKGGLWKKGRK